MSRILRVVIDGSPLADDDAQALWSRFSAHMEASKGDLAGFARAEGFASVHPEVWDGAPTLVISKSAPQKPYANAPKRMDSGPGSGSGAPRGGPSRSNRRGR